MTEQPRRRRRKKPEPLFEEEAAPTTPATGCAIPGCKVPVTEGNQYCVIHEAIEGGKKTVQTKQRQATRKGDSLQAFLYGIGGILLDAATPVVTGMANRAADDPAAAARGAASVAEQAWQRMRATAPPPPPPAPAPDPFAILGLDPTKATAADVRSMQKKLAGLYHGDRAGAAVNTAKMAEINAAATECLKRLHT